MRVSSPVLKVIQQLFTSISPFIRYYLFIYLLHGSLLHCSALSYFLPHLFITVLLPFIFPNYTIIYSHRVHYPDQWFQIFFSFFCHTSYVMNKGWSSFIWKWCEPAHFFFVRRLKMRSDTDWKMTLICNWTYTNFTYKALNIRKRK